MTIMHKRHSDVCRLFVRGMYRALFCCAAWTATSCAADALDETELSPYAPMAFDVSVPEAWIDGSAVDDGASVAVDELRCPDDREPLYLVTEISKPAAARSAATRGAQIGSAADFHTTFGLSAICYAGSYPTGEAVGGLTTNFAHDLKMARSSASSAWASADGTKLFRPGSGRLRFFAYAPHSSDTRLGGALNQLAKSEGGEPRIRYTVPAKPEEQLDIMTAVTDCAGDDHAAVGLSFGHALTAVTVKTGDGMLGGEVTKVELTGVYGSGTHVIGSNAWTVSGAVRSFAVERKVELPDQSDNTVDNAYTEAGKPIVDGDVTLMMIPQTLPEGAALKIHFRDKLSGGNRTLTASLGGKVWPVGRKVAYAVSSTGVVISPKVEIVPSRTDVHPSGSLFGLQLAAYASVAQAGQKDAPVVALPYTVEYATSVDGTNWSEWSAGEWVPDKAPAAGDDPKTKVSGRLKLKPQTSFERLRGSFEKKNLITEAGVGTAANPHDLSEGGETANCYVVNDHGYYCLPTIYGNARGPEGDASYLYKKASVPEATKQFVLTHFVDHDNKWIQGPEIPNVADAVLVWQDAPDLVTEVGYENGMVRFRVAEPTLTQGNAVIAVRDAAKTILWSWHIWVTPYKWDGTEDMVAMAKDGVAGDTEYTFAPCNLGFCEPHGADAARTFRIRFSFTLPDGKETKKVVTCDETFVQSEVVASVAGDNTYYQWGRKDPMLGGIYNSETLTRAQSLATYALQSQYNMSNKVCYPGDPAYAFAPAESGVSIGEAIRQPYLFFMHSYVKAEAIATDDYLRRHWHDGSKSTTSDGKPGQKTIMNYWNSQLDVLSNTNTFDAPNDRKVVKTIYDPCPVGYNVPTPNAFSIFGLSPAYGTSGPNSAGARAFNGTNANGLEDIFDEETNIRIGWKLSLQPGGGEPKIFFPATGLRDMGSADSPTIPSYAQGTTWPAHADLTFVVTTAFTQGSANSSALLFYLDRRYHINEKGEQVYDHIAINGGTNNSYGFSVRPVRRSN